MQIFKPSLIKVQAKHVIEAIQEEQWSLCFSEQSGITLFCFSLQFSKLLFQSWPHLDDYVGKSIAQQLSGHKPKKPN